VDDYQSEKEQIEQFRAWWGEYGNYIVIGVVLGVLGLFGWKYTSDSRLDEQRAASAQYETLTVHVDDGDLDEAAAVAATMVAEYGDTVYVAQAHFAMARLYMDNNRDKDAADELRALLAMRGHTELKHIARNRLARLLLYQDKPDEVLELLDGLDEGAFAARYADARGDAYHALGRYEEARDQYRAALDRTRDASMMAGAASSVDETFVQLKLLDLPVTTTIDAPTPEFPMDQLAPVEPEAPAGEPAGSPTPADPPAEATTE